MEGNQPINKFFVDSGGETTVVCPYCQVVKAVCVLKYRDRHELLKVKCVCGKIFTISLEFRRHYRKSTELEGSFECLPPAASGGRMRIVNLSLEGACFEVNGLHNLKEGARGTMVFTLDDRKKTVITKKMVIRNVTGKRIGCQFVEERAFEKELGFYLFL